MKKHRAVNHQIKNNETNLKTKKSPKTGNEAMKHNKVKMSCEYCHIQLHKRNYQQHIISKHSGLHVCTICDEKFDLKKVNSFNFNIFLQGVR